MQNFRETGFGLVVANVLFTIPVIWTFAVLGCLANQLVNWILPISNGSLILTTQFYDSNVFKSDHSTTFAVVGLVIAQVCFFLTRSRADAVLFPRLRFHLITSIVVILVLAGVLLLNLQHRVQMNFAPSEFAIGYPVFFLLHSPSAAGTFEWSFLVLDVLFWLPVLGLVALIVEFLIAPRVRETAQ